MPVKQPWRRVVAEIAASGTARGRARLGTCSLEGTRVFERALRAGARIESCVVTEGFLGDPDPRIAALRENLSASGCSLSTVTDEVMRRLTDGRAIGEIVGLARLPATPSLDELLEASPGERPLFLACADIDDPGNVGALVRTAHASGARALLCAGTTDAFHPRAVRTSMGSIFRLPVIQWASLAELVEELREAGVRTLGAVSSGGTPLPRVSPDPRPTAILLGSEAFGLPRGAEAMVDEAVSIPMPAGVDSFSVNAAAAVLLYELTREQKENGSA